MIVGNREGDMLFEIEYNPTDNALTLTQSTLDIADEKEIMSRSTVPLFRKPINTEDTKEISDNSDILLEIFKSILEMRYPTYQQKTILEKLVSRSLSRDCLIKMCRVSTCPCPLFYSIGCVDLLLNNIKDSKIFKSMLNMISPIYKPHVLQRIISSSDITRKERAPSFISEGEE